MSDTDGFIDEVTEEVRRDRLYGYVRRYGWIAVLLILAIVGGASWNEWRKAQAISQAEALGDAMIDALSLNDQAARSAAVSDIEADTSSARAVLDMIAAAELVGAENPAAAAERLNALAVNGDVPQVYRDLAAFKALLVQSGNADIAARRAGFEQLAVPGHSMRMLATEQLALIEVETGNVDAAMSQLQAILTDAEASASLQQRALQMIVALGGTPDMSASQSGK